MRIVIDMQGVQASNANRGIGRYSLSLTKAITRNRGEHEIILALNGLFPESIELLRAEFSNLLPQENIHVWNTVSPVSFIDKDNTSRREIAEKVREAFLISLNPDFVLISSLFEGLGDDAVSSISHFSYKIPTATILYDLIPLINPSPYLDNPDVKEWYMDKIEHLQNTDLMLCISKSSKQEAIDYLNASKESVVNISAASEPHFKVTHEDQEQQAELRKHYGLTRPFVMYTGGIDYRKNIEGLIRAYSILPKKLRKEHQLAIVCSLHDTDRNRLNALIQKQGLSKNEVVFTGFVPEKDLVALYNLCKAFVFPSWHEGFGLPALEAMNCGKAVIGANTSSLPEVIGLDSALFDPKNDKSIANKLEQVLTDEVFRKSLEKHGLKQAKKFSWDTSAQIAIAAFEQLQDRMIDSLKKTDEKCPKLAYVSPLPPERSGISDYSVELLPQLAKFYQIDVIVNQDKISSDWIENNCTARSVEWFQDNYKEFDRILYHFGNSHFHQHMFDLLMEIPGIVVLHDFFLSGIIAHLQNIENKPNFWIENLFYSHGYRALDEYFHVQDNSDIIWKYPANLEVLQNALGVIVHSKNSLSLAEQWYGNALSTKWSAIPLLRMSSENIERKKARKILDLPTDAFVVCSFGILGASKLNHRLLQAFLSSSLANDQKCHLVFVGANQPGDYGLGLLKTIKESSIKDRIKITGWADNETFRNYLAAADLGVQLRTLSRGETSAAILDCMNHGLVTIVNANGSMADLPKDAVYMMQDDFTDDELMQALEKLSTDNELRLALGERSQSIIQTEHDPVKCAKQYYRSIEDTYQKSNVQVVPTLIDELAIDLKTLNTSELMDLSQNIANSFPPKQRMKQLFVDISELVQCDAKSGIQRVVRSLLKELIDNPPHGYKIEPVYAVDDTLGYYYARGFMAKFLDYPINLLKDEAIDSSVGDIFLGLDLQPKIIPRQVEYLQDLHRRGILIYFVVYDLLAISKPEFFVSGAKEGYTQWLESITKFDGALCISDAVANELSKWMKEKQMNTLHPFNISWFHLGADIGNSIPSKGLPSNAEVLLNSLKERPTFLMVGTIEPRKGHAQTIAAFEELWKKGIDCNLAIVGKEGWLVEELVSKLKNHPELNKRLFWFNGISDEYLEKIYESSTCLIAASEGEGFGLPLIEAAQKKKPIIARDIPVFKEVAGEYAYYFENSKEPKVIAYAIKEWIDLYKEDKHPKSNDMPWLTWKESKNNLMESIFDKK